MPIRRHPVAAGAPAGRLCELPLDTSLVMRLREVFERLRAHELRLGEIFYARLFQTAPHLRPLFQTPLAEQAQKLIQTLETVVRNFEEPEKNMALLAELGRRHASFGVEPAHYDLVIDVLIESMEQLLGPHADRRHLGEWRIALRLISDQMIAAATGTSYSPDGTGPRSLPAGEFTPPGASAPVGGCAGGAGARNRAAIPRPMPDDRGLAGMDGGLPGAPRTG